jgi:predicted transcriptional regulator
MKNSSRIATIHIQTGNEMIDRGRTGALAAIRSGKYQGEHFGFESPAALFRSITPKRWELLAKLQQTGPLGIRGLARELDRDFRRVHDDVTALLLIGLIEKTTDGTIWVPYKEIRTNFVMHSAAA